MGLDEFPTRGSSGIYNEDGTTRVPKSIRNNMGWGKETSLEWISKNDEEYVRVYKGSDAPNHDDS